jgi:hypothetical protein
MSDTEMQPDAKKEEVNKTSQFETDLTKYKVRRVGWADAPRKGCTAMKTRN